MASFVFSANGGNSSGDGGGSGNNPPDGGGGDIGKFSKVSFRDMVMGNKVIIAPRPKKNLLQEKLAMIEFEEVNPLKPMVHIDESVFEGLYAPWQDALVIKLLRKSLGYSIMKERLSRLWKLSASFEIMDIGNDFFMVKFKEEVDRVKVIKGGPWMIFDHYLTMQSWSPEFVSPIAKIDRTIVWIRFPGLNLFFYDESILMTLAAKVPRSD